MKPKLVAAVSVLIAFKLMLLVLLFDGDRTNKLYKGTWIWDVRPVLEQADETLSFLIQHDVTHLYLYIDSSRIHPGEYATFIRLATDKGLQVEALAGDPAWSWSRNRYDVQAFLDWVDDYNANVAESERFSGIHLDIEPYLLDEWHTDQEEVVNQWLANLKFAGTYANGLGYSLSVDVPFWVDRIQVPDRSQDVGSWMLERFDTIVLMNYRNHAKGNDGLIDNALYVLERADKLGTSVVIGVETAPSSEGNRVSFYGHDPAAMDKELSITRQSLTPYRSFQGVAIHGFPHWMHARQ